LLLIFAFPSFSYIVGASRAFVVADNDNNLALFALNYGETKMIVRKLRSKKNWSQEQLADFCGINVRTVQRVESGQKASIETLKSIACVFEVDISKLTEEITVIDKTSEEWVQLPAFFRGGMRGIPNRRHLLIVEFFLIAGAILQLFTGGRPLLIAFTLSSAYFFSWLDRYGCKKGIWLN